jgi:hypothetical protein
MQVVDGSEDNKFCLSLKAQILVDMLESDSKVELVRTRHLLDLVPLWQPCVAARPTMVARVPASPLCRCGAERAPHPPLALPFASTLNSSPSGLRPRATEHACHGRPGQARCHHRPHCSAPPWVQRLPSPPLPCHDKLAALAPWPQPNFAALEHVHHGHRRSAPWPLIAL